jgi:plasmid stabilization system protein ParE
MGFKVILTPQSLDDLENIVTFIARDNPGRARTFGNELIDRALATAAFPELGRVVPEIGEPAVREIIHGAYRIIYEIFSDRETIYVLRFWHGARGEPEIKARGGK